MNVNQLKELAEFLGLADVYLKATPPPSHKAILARALKSTDLRSGYEAGTLDGEQHLVLLHAVRLEGRAWLRSQGEKLAARIAPLPVDKQVKAVGDEPEQEELTKEDRDELRLLFELVRLYLAQLLKAGLESLSTPGAGILDDPMIQHEMRAQMDQERGYLAKLEEQSLAGNVPIATGLPARLENYGSSVWSNSQATVRSALIRNSGQHPTSQGPVFNQERRRHYGADTPPTKCKVCVQQESVGWKPLGTLRALGDSPCLGNCHCAFSYRDGDTGQEYIAASRILPIPRATALDEAAAFRAELARL